jgi:hypothetical protein
VNSADLAVILSIAKALSALAPIAVPLIQALINGDDVTPEMIAEAKRARDKALSQLSADINSTIAQEEIPT